MSLKVGNISFDCEDPQKVAAFWSAALSLPMDADPNEFFASIGMADAAQSPNWLFMKVPEGKSSKNRLHLDLESDDVAAETARLVGLGATHVAEKAEWGHSWSVFADVEGNEFCVSAPH